jgi:hypothetical protein
VQLLRPLIQSAVLPRLLALHIQLQQLSKHACVWV